MRPINILDLNNAQQDVTHIAEIATSAQATAVDRLGQRKRTISGVVADAALSAETKAGAAMAAIQGVITDATFAVEAAASASMASIGYQPPVAYGAGISITARTQTVSYAGQVFGPNLADIPFTTSGTFESTKFRLISGVTAADLAAASGAALVGNGGESVKESLDALQLPDYAALRAYKGPRKSVYVTGVLGTAAPSGIAGMFVRDDGDTTTADNGDKVIVAGAVRWKRVLTKAENVTLGIDGGNVNDSINMLMSRRAACSYADILDAARTIPSVKSFVREISATRFEVHVPCESAGRYQAWRFDSADANFDGATGFIRPYIITTIEERAIETYIDKSTANGTKTGTWAASGANEYSATAGEKISWVVSGSRIEVQYLATTNAGIAHVTVDGQPANALSLVGGNAVLDTYGTGSSKRTTIAKGLTPGNHTVEVIVTGTQNASSTGARIYLNTAAALRAFSPYSLTAGGESLYPTMAAPIAIGYWKLTSSALDYAVSFRPDAMPAAALPFIGSVHGYENRQSLEIYIDGALTTLMSAAPYTRMIAGDKIRIVQTSYVQHPESLTNYAAVTVTHAFDADGYTQSTKWTWLQKVFVSNGYSQMFAVNGGLAGGVAGAFNGWCNRVTFAGIGTYDVSAGQLGEFGHAMASEIVFWGTPKLPAETDRDADAGNRVVVVSIPDLARSMNYLQNPQAVIDGAWVQDKNNLKKLYVQHYRAAGTIHAGNGFSGKMRVKLYSIPMAYTLVQ